MAMLRSLLFVPGDSERKIAKAADSAADALILDVEDSVLPERKAEARGLCREALQAHGPSKRAFVRVNALESGLTAMDLAHGWKQSEINIHGLEAGGVRAARDVAEERAKSSVVRRHRDGPPE